MYPFKRPLASTFVFNQWYVVAAATELGERPLARTVLGRPLALFRTGSGEPTVVDGLCPHRRYPLGGGESRVVGDELQCGYHGIRFDRAGQCTLVPGLPKPSRHLRLVSYPVVERSGWVWAWLGDPDRADPAALPAAGLPELDTADWRRGNYFYERIEGRYTLLLENLMDLSHLSYLHGSVIRDTSLADQPLDVESHPDRIRAVRRLAAAPIGAQEAMVYGARPGGTYALDNISDYHGPSLVITGNTPKDGAPEGFGRFRFVHGVTPETETTTHYFVLVARDFRVDDPDLDPVFDRFHQIIPYQDKAAIEAIEPVDDELKFQERSQPFDRGALLIRQRLEQQLVEEQQGTRTNGPGETTAGADHFSQPLGAV
ncbi:aromatic ring-hydroxylating dioxygenase subunit alpha [Streptomyces sp. B21-108]|jgi:vanillate O-demethylase monooxygenase subunit|uniref:aromatic ring-hydroxylating dioxygenase subunit alpha n=1 Tax=Streptomyces sp. B21-108 TaxID=3039419 RepID=UPI002FEF75EB